MKYFVIKCTGKAYRWAKEESTWYHAGGRGNGAFANLYEEKQVNRILGQYKNSDSVKAEAIEVVFVEPA